jgi:hypothetical protein
MSVEATALSRSKLEQKDRAELAAIVEAMGGKSGSRAKKADLVDQVLELAGQGNSGSRANGGEAHGPSTASAESDSPPQPVAGATTPAEEPPAEWELAVATDAPSDAPGETAPDASTATAAPSADTSNTE